MFYAISPALEIVQKLYPLRFMGVSFIRLVPIRLAWPVAHEFSGSLRVVPHMTPLPLPPPHDPAHQLRAFMHEYVHACMHGRNVTARKSVCRINYMSYIMLCLIAVFADIHAQLITYTQTCRHTCVST